MTLRNFLSFAGSLRQVRDVPRLSSDQLATLQRRRLRKLLQHTLRRSSFYRTKYGNVDVDSVEFSSLPTVTKDEIRDHFDNVVTDPRLRREELENYVLDEQNLGRWYLGEYAISHTSGSQGSPLLIVQDRNCLHKIFALMAARSSPDGVPSPLEGIRRWFRPKRVVAISFRRGFYPSGMTLEFMPEIVRPFVQVTRLSSIQPDLITRLNELRPHVITGYASVLEGLAVQSEQLRLPELEYITNSSEQLSLRSRKRIENGFGVPVFDHYGTGECLQLADGCRHCNGVHVNADWAILESVDESNRPVPAGTVGARILVTNLANFAQPFIRYEIGDCVSLAGSGCGSHNHLPAISRIEGRAVDLLWVRDGEHYRFLTGILFHAAVDSVSIVREWRAIQRERNLIELQIQILSEKSSPNQQDLINTLAQRLTEYGLPRTVTLRIQIVPQLEPDARTGKMRRIISEVGPPDREGVVSGIDHRNLQTSWTAAVASSKLSEAFAPNDSPTVPVMRGEE